MNLPKKIYDRKIKLKYENTLITGPKKVGKTFLVFNFLKSFKGKYRYIDFKDYRNKNLDFQNIDLVILDNYDFSIPIPEITTFIISSKNIDIPNFKKIELFNLDFEEFFAFNSSTHVNLIFNKFIKFGNFPKIFNEEYFNEEYLKETFELLPYNKTILKFLFSHIGEKFTIHQIYQIIKRDNKISKDTIYKEINNLINDKLIFFVEDFKNRNNPKKIFSYNFAFKNILTNNKNIFSILENSIYLEIKNKKPFYLDKINFYFPDSNFAIMLLPFATKEIVKEKIKQIDIKLDKLIIITVSNEFKIENNNFNVEVIPFTQWIFAE